MIFPAKKLTIEGAGKTGNAEKSSRNRLRALFVNKPPKNNTRHMRKSSEQLSNKIRRSAIGAGRYLTKMASRSRALSAVHGKKINLKNVFKKSLKGISPTTLRSMSVALAGMANNEQKRGLSPTQIEKEAENSDEIRMLRAQLQSVGPKNYNSQ